MTTKLNHSMYIYTLQKALFMALHSLDDKR